MVEDTTLALQPPPVRQYRLWRPFLITGSVNEI